ncbi:MAG: hypothetical protein M9942_10555 [Microthrixaceae bacterium]|nr:hypothetical protein [Microthrixaceae bacterium]MCO5318866.1 hypothetical protein [Microthrixaceae bacterium]
MSNTRTRGRALAAPVLLSLAVLFGTACAPTPTTPKGISFNAPSIGYVGKQYTPTATSSSGLPVSFALDASSTGCSFADGIIHFESVGDCVINADQPGDATHPADPQVQRTITIHECPPLRPGTWTGPLDLSAEVAVDGSTFTGTVDLSSLGYGVQDFGGTVSCEVVNMTFNGTPLTGRLSTDGSRLSSSYQGIAIVLYAPAV